jgi:hypothetical protein
VDTGELEERAVEERGSRSSADVAAAVVVGLLKVERCWRGSGSVEW